MSARKSVNRRINAIEHELIIIEQRMESIAKSVIRVVNLIEGNISEQENTIDQKKIAESPLIYV